MQKRTYLNQEQIKDLANVFPNEEIYREHLKTLWALRESVSILMEKEEGNPNVFRIFDLTNKIINAIDDGSVSIVNGEIQVDLRNKFR